MINRRKALKGIAAILGASMAPAFIPLGDLMALPAKRTAAGIIHYSDIELMIMDDLARVMAMEIDRAIILGNQLNPIHIKPHQLMI